MIKKLIQISVVISILSLSTIPVLSIQSSDNYDCCNFDSYIDITVEEAWNLLNDVSNGIQIPIDVRTDSEWATEHIDTPVPENPRHHNFYEWDDEEILNEFLSMYEGQEIIIYCRTGSRSVTASNILIDNGFNGIIYNMLGGITTWKSEGYPTIGNLPPELPDIVGPSSGAAGQDYTYTFSSLDPDGDQISFCINWSDEMGEVCLGPYDSEEEVTFIHNWAEQGTYFVQVKARDKYNAESEWATLEVSMPKSKIPFRFIDILYLFFPRIFTLIF